MSVDRRKALAFITLGVGSFSTNPVAALEACTPTQAPRIDAGSNNGFNCEKEVRIAYLAGAHRPGEQIIAALTDRTADVVIEGMNPIKLRVGPRNNSGVAYEDSAAAFRRSVTVGGLVLNYIAVPVGQRDTVSVRVHRLNINGTRRDDEASNPPAKTVDTCLVEGGPDLYTPTGLNTIQVFAQDSELGTQPGQYTNSKNDLVFQEPGKLFQGVELGYLLKK